jgi:hypothetical protein
MVWKEFGWLTAVQNEFDPEALVINPRGISIRGKDLEESEDGRKRIAYLGRSHDL